MSFPLNHRDFEVLDVVKYSDLILLSLNSEEVENYLIKMDYWAILKEFVPCMCSRILGNMVRYQSFEQERTLYLMIPTSNKVRDMVFCVS